MGGCTLMASAVAEAAPQETPTEAREKETSVSKTLGLSGALGDGDGSTVLLTTTEKYEVNGSVGNIEGCVKLLVNSEASENYLDDHSGLRKRRSDYVRLEEPREITTARSHKLKRSCCRIHPRGPS